MDFASHEPVSAQALERFEVDPQDGPDLDDLHFDVAKGMRSQWNKTALQLIQLRLGEELYEDGDDVPERSEQYLAKLIQERFQRLVVVWKNAQPLPNAGGEMESYEAVEKRMMEDKDIELKSCRHTTRRISVGQFQSCST